MHKISQSPNAIFMIRPGHFGFNALTADSNAFQVNVNEDPHEIARRAQGEFDEFVKKLKTKGIDVFVFEENNPQTPDAVFPNNWISFHRNGEVVLYPLLAKNRRLERRDDILSVLERQFTFDSILDLSVYEKENKFLEGTGSIVFDYINKLAFASRSPRTHDDLFYMCCNELGYEPVLFSAVDEKGMDIYHTNVLMAIADEFAIICTSCISAEDKGRVLNILRNTNREIIEISFDQMNHFLGNMIQLSATTSERFMVMSQSAYQNLLPEQKMIISDSCDIIYSDLTTIERYGGGSARCMIAGIFLPSKK